MHRRVETPNALTRRDETSNAPLRRGVQPNVEISSHSETAEIEYIWSVQMTATTSWTSATRKQKIAVGSDNPNTLELDYPTKELG